MGNWWYAVTVMEWDGGYGPTRSLQLRLAPLVELSDFFRVFALLQRLAREFRVVVRVSFFFLRVSCMCVLRKGLQLCEGPRAVCGIASFW